jgi:hypothetical protein
LVLSERTGLFIMRFEFFMVVKIQLERFCCYLMNNILVSLYFKYGILYIK